MESEFLETIAEFDGRSFSTLDFANQLKVIHEPIWLQLVEKYGVGGKGAGTQYSAYSYMSHQLNKLYNSGELEKLDYRKSPPEYGNPYIRYWAENKNYYDFPDEIDESTTISEGAKKTVTVNKYERNRAARTLCIEKYGVSCFVCDFNFEEKYGSLGAGFIHVHHLKPLGEVGEEYQLDPVKDLRPVCPNCHAMLHRHKPAIPIEELKEKI
ncbi:HNH endonuclease [Vibrio parahaemolyticus]